MSYDEKPSNLSNQQWPQPARVREQIARKLADDQRVVALERLRYALQIRRREQRVSASRRLGVVLLVSILWAGLMLAWMLV